MKTKVTKKSGEKKCAAKKCTAKKCAVKKPCKTKQEKKSVSFTIHAERGKDVYLAGEFNGWDPAAKKMAYKARSGVYATTIKLAAGKYQYKFVIDGVWCADPENADSVANDQGTFNSIVTVE
jgi:1,4-alpha-glucan branching enzyme